MLLPKAQNMRATSHTMALVAHSIDGTKYACACADVVVPWAFQSCPGQMAKNEHAPTGLDGQLIVGLCVDSVEPYKPPQTGAKLGLPKDSTTRRNVPPLLDRQLLSRHSLVKSKVMSAAKPAT